MNDIPDLEPTFRATEEARAVRWKDTTTTLPDAAREPAPYIRDGRPQGCYATCLPPEFAEFNLLPEARVDALDLFRRFDIKWHAAIDDGPTNHLLSSQVQCVNALAPL